MELLFTMIISLDSTLLSLEKKMFFVAESELLWAVYI